MYCCGVMIEGKSKKKKKRNYKNVKYKHIRVIAELFLYFPAFPFFFYQFQPSVHNYIYKCMYSCVVVTLEE